jgi:2-keto-3-deoxy-6-phosphogluconate aldolase
VQKDLTIGEIFAGAVFNAKASSCVKRRYASFTVKPGTSSAVTKRHKHNGGGCVFFHVVATSCAMV